MNDASDIVPGLLVLHGNRLELLRDAVVDWISRQPLGALEDEVFLVQSNGAAEWLKMSLARAHGVCAATRVELPARFLWRAYRRLLGPEAVPTQSALDRPALAWRLMRRLPLRGDDPVFAPISRFLAAGASGSGGGTSDGTERRWQLAQRLADLFDQYQVYRADWLDAWARGHDVLPADGRPAMPVPEDQRWQPALWRDLLAELDDVERRGIRPEVHRRFVERALAEAPAGASGSSGPAGSAVSPEFAASRLPRRVVLFGASHVPAQTLEALVALGRRSQVILAVPNPCRFHWADIIDGRELLRPAPARHAARAGRALADVPLEAMHAHAHPLLAAWGRQGRDFMRQLDAFDDAAETRRRFDLPRIDLFDESPGATMLEQLQADIRDLLPLAETPRRIADDGDRSIVFHVAHSAQREVEILHDQLLRLLAEAPADRPLAPRDIVVMVPDIEAFAPAVRAVFGQVPRDDARFIPFEIADLRNRGSNPLVVALEWLLRAPSQRFRASEVRDLLDVPGIAARFDLADEDLAPLGAWIEGAGVRWGLGEAQRASLGLGTCGDQNSWAFGLRRMLLGFAVGEAPRDVGAGGAGSRVGSEGAEADAYPIPYHGIEPYAEIGGLDAARVGSLADLLRVLDDWWRDSMRPLAPGAWAERGRALLEALVDPVDERERLTVASLQQALADWLAQCDQAGFDEAVPLAVMREAWLGGVDAPGGGGRFLAGGVTFCTLMPLRAVPFEVVALLGMNDGDFPRAASRSDFDLMALPGRQRPGDRSRRDDDRYLMLEALLSARRALHVSWTGRSVRDNAEQPPSVLVSQLRDHLRAGWRTSADGDAVEARTTQHPLQPFGRRYFEGGALFTYAAEWRPAHDLSGSEAAGSTTRPPAALAPPAADESALTLDRLARFLRQPVREFFRVQLDVDLRLEDATVDDDEPFGLDPLEQHQLIETLVAESAASAVPGGDADAWADTLFARPAAGSDDAVRAALGRRLAALRREGRLPVGEIGERAARGLADVALPMRRATRALEAAHPRLRERVPVRRRLDDVALDDWLDGLRDDPAGDAADAEAEVDAGAVVGEDERVVNAIRLSWTASALLAKKPPKKGEARHKDEPLRPERFVDAWVHVLAAAACGHRVRAVLVGRDAVVALPAPDAAEAKPALDLLLGGWRDGMSAPLPFALSTAFTWLQKPEKAPAAYEGDGQRTGEAARDPHLARMFPDWDALQEDGAFPALAVALLSPMTRWLASPGITVARHPDAASGEDDEEGGDE